MKLRKKSLRLPKLKCPTKFNGSVEEYIKEFDKLNDLTHDSKQRKLAESQVTHIPKINPE